MSEKIGLLEGDDGSDSGTIFQTGDKWRSRYFKIMQEAFSMSIFSRYKIFVQRERFEFTRGSKVQQEVFTLLKISKRLEISYGKHNFCYFQIEIVRLPISFSQIFNSQQVFATIFTKTRIMKA